MTDHIFSLLPLYPDTDTKLTLATQRSYNQFHSLKVESWRRLFQNKNVVQVEAFENSNYQCTPLDAYCCIEVRISYKLLDKLVNSKLVSKPVQIKNELKEMLLYDPSPIKVRVLLDNFQTFMTVSIVSNKLRFLSQIGKYQIILNESTVQADPNPTVLKINFHSQKNQFVQFFSSAIKVGGKFRSSFCAAVFSSKNSRDIFCCQIANLFRDNKIISQGNNKIIQTSPRVNHNLLKNDHSATSLTSIQNSKHSQHKDRKKVKISQRLNLKKSSTNTKPNTSKIDNSSKQCLNIFEEDDFPMENSKTTENILNDMSMDLRGSFEEFQNTGTAKVEEDMLLDNSFRQKKGNWLNPIDQQNKKLRQENIRLKRQLQEMGKIHKQYTMMKKKFDGAMEQIKSLQSERVAILTDKVKFQSMYNKESQQKKALMKQLEYIRNTNSPQYGMRRI